VKGSGSIGSPWYIEAFDWLGRDSPDDRILGNIPGHNRIGSHNCPFSDDHVREDDGAGPDPCVLLHDDVSLYLFDVRPDAGFIRSGMKNERDSRGDRNTVSKGNFVIRVFQVVDDDGVLSDVDILPDSVVTVPEKPDPDVVPWGKLREELEKFFSDLEKFIAHGTPLRNDVSRISAILARDPSDNV
jgi:hypothetical protein